MSPNPLLAMAPINVQTAAAQGSPNGKLQQSSQQTRQNMQNNMNNGSPHHRKNSKRQRERNTPSPKHNRGSPKPKQSNIPSSSSRRNYTPPPRFQKLGQVDGAINKNVPSSYSSEDGYSSMSISSDENSNDSTKENYAGAKFHSEAPGPETLPMPPSNWLMGCVNPAATAPNCDPKYQQQLASELKYMLKVAL